MAKLLDPLVFAKQFWPHVNFYKEQIEIIYSVVDNDETIVPAGNMLGKDFVSAFIALYFFLTRHPCRVVTTSVDGTQLEAVLWGEVRRFIQSSRCTMPLVVNHLHLRKIVKRQVCGISYMIGRVSAKGEGMLGHHVTPNAENFFDDDIPRTLFIADEASGVDNIIYERAETWARRTLVIGNPYPCTNFFYKKVKAGDVKNPQADNYYTKVIKIRAQDSPNVRWGIAEEKAGIEPSNKSIVPGVMPYKEYLKRRQTWDNIRQCIGLDAEFYEGVETLLFPPEWLNRAEQIAHITPMYRRKDCCIGVDPAEGGDSTVWSIVDRRGLVLQVSMKTPDTSMITNRTIALMKEYNVTSNNVLFDRGGGGKEHADRLRSQGYPVRTVAFGEAASDPTKYKRRFRLLDDIVEETEVRYVFKNRRAEMYGLLRHVLNPANASGFGLPAMYTELRRQLAPIPLTYDEEGRLVLPPKTKKNKNSTIPTLTDIIGHSPDEADSLVLGVFGLFYEDKPIEVGSIYHRGELNEC